MTDINTHISHASEGTLAAIMAAHNLDRITALEQLYAAATREQVPFVLANGRLISPTALQALDHAEIETLTAANLRGFAALDLPNASYVHLANC